MKRLCLVTLALLVLLSGCKKKEAAPPPAPPPPPPTSAEDLRGGIMTELTPFLVPIEEMPTPIIDAQRAEATAKLREQCNKVASEENRDRAKNMVKSDLMEQLKAAYDAELWNMTLLLCDLVDILDTDTVRTSRYRVRAQTEKNRPRPTVTGIVTDPRTEVSTVFMDVYLPETDKTEKVQVRVGEEFFGLKLLEITGRNTGIKFLYTQTGATYEAPGPRRQ